MLPASRIIFVSFIDSMVIGSLLLRGTKIINKESGSLTTAWYNIPGVMPYVSEQSLWHYLMLPSWGSNSNVDNMIKNDRTCASKKIHNTNFLLFRVQLCLKSFFHPTSDSNGQGRSRRNYNLLVVTLVSEIVQPCWSLLREQTDCHIWNLHDFLTKFTNFHQSKTRCFIHENGYNCIYITSSISSKQPPIRGIWSCSVISTVSSNVPRKRKLNECTSNILLNITSISYNISS